jgi:hypothetical protein
MVPGSLLAAGRRAWLVAGLATVVSLASVVRADRVPGQEAADPFKLNADVGLLVFQIKPDKASDFESAWTTIKDKLSKSDKADWKELGDSVKVFKVSNAAAGQPAVYVFHLSPPSKTLSYEPVKILYSSGLFERAEADALYKKISDAFAGLTSWPLTKVIG